MRKYTIPAVVGTILSLSWHVDQTREKETASTLLSSATSLKRNTANNIYDVYCVKSRESRIPTVIFTHHKRPDKVKYCQDVIKGTKVIAVIKRM